MAAFNDVECSGKVNGQRADLEIERAWGGASIRTAILTVHGARGTNSAVTRYTINSVRGVGPQIEFRGFDHFNLTIDLFPDNAPHWGRIYHGRFTVNNAPQNIFTCQFPNARP